MKPKIELLLKFESLNPEFFTVIHIGLKFHDFIIYIDKFNMEIPKASDKTVTLYSLTRAINPFPKNIKLNKVVVDAALV